MSRKTRSRSGQSEPFLRTTTPMRNPFRVFVGDAIIWAELFLYNRRSSAFWSSNLVCLAFYTVVLTVISPFAILLIVGHSLRTLTDPSPRSKRSPIIPRTLAHPSVRVATYNVQGGVGMDGVHDIDRTRRCIVEECNSPDIVGLQEVELHSSLHEGDMVADLAGDAYPHHRFIFTRALRGGEYGIAMLSKHPILEERVLSYPGWPRRNPRKALALRLHPTQWPAPRWFVVTHFQNDPTGLEQEEEAELLLEFVAELRLSAEVVLMGDFNLPPMFRAWKRLAHVLVTVEQQACGTIPADRPRIRIDHVLSSAPLVEGYTERVVPSISSDHRPVVVDLPWPLES